MKKSNSSTAENHVYSTESFTGNAVYPILFALAFSHLLNDSFQSLIPAIYPLVKDLYDLSFSQIGFITFTFQMSASILQPVVGLYTDKYPKPRSLGIGMVFTTAGLLSFALSENYIMLLFSVALVGIGSSIFHPESSRIAHFASGGRKGMAQSLFQVGGRTGASLGPLFAAFIIMPYGQITIIWFAFAAIAAIVLLNIVGKWYGQNRENNGDSNYEGVTDNNVRISNFSIPRKHALLSLFILLVLTFSKFVYLAGMNNFLTFFLMDKFGVAAETSQIRLFIFIAATAAGTYIGGSLGDRIGRKYVIWVSILGVTPFTILLPYVGLIWTGILTVIIGLILSSAFASILVFAQELMPGKLGMISGLFYGFAFGIAGLGSALLGVLADHTSIEFVFKICSFLPLIGLITAFLPDLSDNLNCTSNTCLNSCQRNDK